MPEPTRILVLPCPPKSFPKIPSVLLGDQAIPRRGAKLLYRVGARVLGIPASPGYKRPVGAVGYWVDCWPGTIVTILSCVSYHGWLNSQRKPTFTVRLDLTRIES